MTPGRRISRRSFLGMVGGTAAAGGALLVIAGGKAAAQPRAGDGDFASPLPMGDTFRSDPPPGPQTGRTDRDSGPAFDPVNQGAGTGQTRRATHAARCAELRRRFVRIGAARPRTAEHERWLAAMRPLMTRWRCG